MIKTPELEFVCTEIGRLEPDWGRIVQKYSQMYAFSKRKTIQELLKQFSEIHLDICLETISEDSGIAVDFNQLPRQETEKNTFRYDKFGRLYARFKDPKNGQDFEYDTVVTINGIPVDFEISLKRPEPGARFGKKMSLSGKLSSRFYDRKLAPLRELFDSDIGYVFVLPKDVYRFYSSPNRITAANFKLNNGLLAQLTVTAEEFKYSVWMLAQQKTLINPNMMHKRNFKVTQQVQEASLP
jgi:hypothetical protein